MRSNILIVDDNEDILTAIRILLSKGEYNVITENSPKRIPILMKKWDFDLILLDMNFTKGANHGEEGFTSLKTILDIDPNAVVILITAYGDIDLAVEGMQKGAADFIQKPWDNQKLLSTISIACDLNREKEKNRLLETRNRLITKDFDDIIGQSSPMLKVFDLINKVSKTDVNILITGENGTGKELIARAIHSRSNRKDSCFLGVDMGSIPQSLFESEMFGHEKGAFTGADQKRIGRIEATSGGTLFLDEIGNIPLHIQPKLLRVLETREVVPLGGKGHRPFDIRLICATNSNIEDMIESGDFRQDLLYRINTVEIEIPPLRERRDDIPLLLKHFLNIYMKKYNRRELTITPSCIKQLLNYAWPGNVRELNHLVERAVILSSGNSITIEDFTLSGIKSKEFQTSTYNLSEVEREIIKRAIESEDGNLTKSAQILGITRATLYRKIEKYGI